MINLLEARVEPCLPKAAVGQRVLIIEVDALAGQLLALRLQDAGFRVGVCVLDDDVSVLEHTCALVPRVVLLDLVLRGCSVNASSLVPRLRSLGAEVIAFTSDSDSFTQTRAVDAGVSRIVSKAAPIEELLEAIRVETSHEPRIAASQRAAVIEQLRRYRAQQRARLAPFETLTRREAAVLEHMTRGRAAEAIAADCFVSLATVRSQIRAVLMKLGVNSQLAAVAMAYRAGWTAEQTPGL